MAVWEKQNNFGLTLNRRFPKSNIWRDWIRLWGLNKEKGTVESAKVKHPDLTLVSL